MKFPDERCGKLVVVAHCILNQNSRVLGLAQYSAVIGEIVDVLRKHDVGLVQMSCPELTYAGISRPSKTKEEYNTPKYRKQCKQIAASTARLLEEFAKNGIMTLAILGIKGSPSCGIGDSAEETGILMEALLSELKKRRLEIPVRALDMSNIVADVKWLEKVLKTV